MLAALSRRWSSSSTESVASRHSNRGPPRTANCTRNTHVGPRAQAGSEHTTRQVQGSRAGRACSRTVSSSSLGSLSTERRSRMPAASTVNVPRRRRSLASTGDCAGRRAGAGKRRNGETEKRRNGETSRGGDTRRAQARVSTHIDPLRCSLRRLMCTHRPAPRVQSRGKRTSSWSWMNAGGTSSSCTTGSTRTLRPAAAAASASSSRSSSSSSSSLAATLRAALVASPRPGAPAAMPIAVRCSKTFVRMQRSLSPLRSPSPCPYPCSTASPAVPVPPARRVPRPSRTNVSGLGDAAFFSLAESCGIAQNRAKHTRAHTQHMRAHARPPHAAFPLFFHSQPHLSAHPHRRRRCW